MIPHIPIDSDGLPIHDYIKVALYCAVQRTLDCDFDLLALGGHEQAISHRIAVYLESSFPGYHTDCEYNRSKAKGKFVNPESPSDDTKMRPDIIVHRRNTDVNVLATEMKAQANKETSGDLRKLKSLKTDAHYLYKRVAFIRIDNGMKQMEDGILRALIQWYDCGSSGFVHLKDEDFKLTCDDHREEVLRIIQQRKEKNESD